ncbi:hypothetical protein BJ165DRAFT_1409043 [Panaeolus papilionaceus]|nr:hypothetical protein BJ165DRAFT_1409043 [Panaeolus papilionaceus]
MENNTTPWILPPPRFQVAQLQVPTTTPRRTFYKIGIGVIVPTLASTPTCSTPDLAIIVSPYDGFTSPSPSRFASIYTPSFIGGSKEGRHSNSSSSSSELEFVMQHELSTLLHDTYTLRAPRVLVGVFPIIGVQERDTPRQVLHKYLLRVFNGRGVFQHSSLWSNTTWVFTVLEYLCSPYAFYTFASAAGEVPKPIDVLNGWELQKYGGISTFGELEERLMAIWRRMYRKCDVEVGRVRMRCLYDLTPGQIVPGKFGAPVRPRLQRPRRNAVVQLHQQQQHQQYHHHQHQRQYQHHNQHSHSSSHYHPYHLNQPPHHQSYHQNQNQNPILPYQLRYNHPTHPHPHHPSRVNPNDSCSYNATRINQNSGLTSSEPRMIYDSRSVRSAFGDNTNRF